MEEHLPVSPGVCCHLIGLVWDRSISCCTLTAVRGILVFSVPFCLLLYLIPSFSVPRFIVPLFLLFLVSFSMFVGMFISLSLSLSLFLSFFLSFVISWPVSFSFYFLTYLFVCLSCSFCPFSLSFHACFFSSVSLLHSFYISILPFVSVSCLLYFCICFSPSYSLRKKSCCILSGFSYVVVSLNPLSVISSELHSLRLDEAVSVWSETFFLCTVCIIIFTLFIAYAVKLFVSAAARKTMFLWSLVRQLTHSKGWERNVLSGETWIIFKAGCCVVWWSADAEPRNFACRKFLLWQKSVLSNVAALLPLYGSFLKYSTYFDFLSQVKTNVFYIWHGRLVRIKQLFWMEGFW